MDGIAGFQAEFFAFFICSDMFQKSQVFQNIAKFVLTGVEHL